ncbi:MAG TPA: nitroreductase family protein [Pseudobdellovibrionaceae bacterium]|nr:nitroreductase family protein [Pseudobdellovibrionaceae bacterium]
MNKEEFYRLLEARRSIRKYKKDLPPKEAIDRILAAGLQAPSGKNLQNWRFFVVTGKKKDEYLAHSQKSWLSLKAVLQRRLKPSLYEFTERFFFTLGEAPVIVFCYSHNDPEERYHTNVGSVYMAVENMNLACFAEGLGCCTMGAPLEIKEDVDRFLGVTEREDYQKGELELLCALVIGFPDHSPPKAPRQLEDRIHWIDS